MTRLFIKALVAISLILSFNLKTDIITVNWSGTLNFNSDSSSGTDVMGLDGVNIYITSIFKAANTPDQTDIMIYPIDNTIIAVTWYSKSFEITALDDNEETILPEPALLATFSLRRRKKFDKSCSIA